MDAAISYLLMLHKYISSKEKILKEKINYTLCLGNISKDFIINNMTKKQG